MKIGRCVLQYDGSDDWDMLIEALTERMQKKNKNGYWFAKVENFGWNKRNGEKYFKAVTGKELLSHILPDTDCTFNIHNYGTGFAIQNFHHDSPVGDEWYYIKVINEGQYNKHIR